MTTMFTSEQQSSLIAWLEAQRDAGLTIQDLINGLTDGTFTTPEAEVNTSITE